MFWTVGEIMLYVVVWLVIFIIAGFIIAGIFILIFKVVTTIVSAVREITTTTTKGILNIHPVVWILIALIGISWLYYWVSY